FVPQMFDKRKREVLRVRYVEGTPRSQIRGGMGRLRLGRLQPQRHHPWPRTSHVRMRGGHQASHLRLCLSTWRSVLPGENLRHRAGKTWGDLFAAGAARALSGSTFCWTIALPHAGTCHGGTSPSLGTDPYGVVMSRPRLPQVSVDRA